MPEGDTIFRAARTLNRALAGQVVTGFETQLPKLARVHYDSRITGRTVEKVEAQGKWMLMQFSGGLILLTHMLMSGTGISIGREKAGNGRTRTCASS
jgi:endonuclease-8